MMPCPVALPARAFPRRASIVAAGLLALGLAVAWLLGDLPSADWLLDRQQEITALQSGSPWLFGGGFFVIFTLLAALTLPGCSLLCLAAGLCFGVWSGTAMVAAASTAGAAMSFLVARHGLRDWAMRRFGRHLGRVQAAMARDGSLVLLTLRLAPVVPFALVNPLMGLTRMPLPRFAALSFIGMLPGSAAYVVAGTELSNWAAGGTLWSPALGAALLSLALLPWFARAAWRRFATT